MRSTPRLSEIASPSAAGQVPARQTFAALCRLIEAATADTRAVAPERIDIEVRQGYRPARTTAPSGVPLRVVFHRSDNDHCTERVIFSSPRIERRLAPGMTTVVDLPAQPPGVVRFTCGMGRYRGEIEVAPAPQGRRGPLSHSRVWGLAILVAAISLFVALVSGALRMPFVIDIDPVLASFGGFALRWYSVMLLVSIAVAYTVFAREARRLRLDEWVTSDGVIWVGIAALGGGRLLFEIQNELPMVAASPIHLLMVWEGGLSFYGGLIAAIAAIAVIAIRRGLPVWRVLDAAAPAAAIGQAVGHVGCLITGDSYGLPTSLPWGIVYRNPAAMAPHGVPLQPTQVYEAFALVFLFVALWLGRAVLARVGPGAVAACYLLGVASIRFALFFLRDEQSAFLGLKTAQLIGLGLGAAGLVILARALRQRSRTVGFNSKEFARP